MTHPVANCDRAPRALQAIERATAAYGGGRCGEAEQICRQILRATADHFEVLTLLGIMAARAQRLKEAADLFARAAAARPQDADAHSNLGNVLKGLGRYPESLASYDGALALEPRFADVYTNPGNVFRQRGRIENALANYERALHLQPDHAEACFNQAVVLQALRRFEEALTSCERALRIKPDFAEAWHERGNALRELALRAKLDANRSNTPLFDTPAFTTHLELAFLRIHQRQLEDLPPDHCEPAP